MKFKIGDKVILRKGAPLYKSSTATSTTSYNSKERITNITRIAQGTKHPYNTTGDLGWCNESDLKLYEDPVKKYEGELTLIDKNGLVDYLMEHYDKILVLSSEQLKDILTKKE